jgi:hypothetical protein
MGYDYKESILCAACNQECFHSHSQKHNLGHVKVQSITFALKQITPAAVPQEYNQAWEKKRQQADVVTALLNDFCILMHYMQTEVMMKVPSVHCPRVSYLPVELQYVLQLQLFHRLSPTQESA